MSKKVLLEEKATRRMMELARLGNYSEKFLNENMGYNEEEELEEVGHGNVAPPNDPRRGPNTQEEGEMDEEEMEVDVDAGEGGGGDEEKFREAVEALADIFGVKATIEGGEGDMDAGDELGDLDVDMGDDEGGEEGMGDEEDAEEDDEEDEEEYDEEDEEELDEVKHKKGEREEEEEEEEEEMEEGRLSEDDLVENVLNRVTARLLAEAKKAKGKKEKDIKKKMADKKAKKKDDKKKKEALDEELKGTNLATKGKNKDKLYPGHENMEYKKGTSKGGKGGHAYSELKNKGEHTKTHKKS